MKHSYCRGAIMEMTPSHPQLLVPLVRTLKRVKHEKWVRVLQRNHLQGIISPETSYFEEHDIFWQSYFLIEVQHMKAASPSTTAKSREMGMMSSSDTSSAVMAILRCV